jgi:hypothetical protein
MSAFRSQRAAGHRRRGVCGHNPEVVGLVDQFLAEFTCEGPERLRLFADRVFEECQDRIRREPRCLPVMGAVAARGEVIIRGLIYSPGATKEYAEEFLAELMVQLFEERKPEYGAIVFRALSEPDGAELLVVVAMEGATGHAASFVGRQGYPPTETADFLGEPPLPRHTERVEALEMLFAGGRPVIDFGNQRYWTTWLKRSAAREN